MPDLSSLITVDTLVSFLALTFLEVVLGVDNIVFVVLAADTLPPKERGRGRQLGLLLGGCIEFEWGTRNPAAREGLPKGSQSA